MFLLAQTAHVYKCTMGSSTCVTQLVTVFGQGFRIFDCLGSRTSQCYSSRVLDAGTQLDWANGRGRDPTGHLSPAGVYSSSFHQHCIFSSAPALDMM